MIDRFKCRFDNLIGKPYGYKYEIQNQDFEIKRENVEEEAENNNNINNEGLIISSSKIIKLIKFKLKLQ
jgi:hypothetical protein